jgi:hypothetical protein
MTGQQSIAQVTPLRARDHGTPVYLSPEQVCELVPGMTLRRLAEHRAARTGPVYSKPSQKTVVYIEADIHAWVLSTRQATRDER